MRQKTGKYKYFIIVLKVFIITVNKSEYFTANFCANKPKRHKESGRKDRAKIIIQLLMHKLQDGLSDSVLLTLGLKFFQAKKEFSGALRQHPKRININVGFNAISCRTAMIFDEQNPDIIKDRFIRRQSV